MNELQKNIKTWVDALRSGEYKQTRSKLNSDYGFCCIGVACDLFIEEEKKQRDDRGCISGNQPFAPRWISEVNEMMVRSKFQMTLIDMNDYMYWNFNEIANALEENYLKDAAI